MNRGKCQHCEDPWKLVWAGEPLASSHARYSLLYRCPGCALYYEFKPGDQRTPVEISEGEADDRFGTGAGAAEGPAIGECKFCADPWAVYRLGNDLAINIVRHSALYRCHGCGAYYEVVPEERKPPERLSASEIRATFPDFETAPETNLGD